MASIESQKSIIILPLRPPQPLTLFRLSILNAIPNSWKESSLCFIEAWHSGTYSLTSSMPIRVLLASPVPTLKCFRNFAFFFGDSFLSFYCFWQKILFRLLLTCYFFHYLLYSLSIVFVFIQQRSWVVFLLFYFKLFKNIFVVIIFVFRLSAFVFFNLIYSICLVLEDFCSPLLNQGVFKFFCLILISVNGKFTSYMSLKVFRNVQWRLFTRN